MKYLYIVLQVFMIVLGTYLYTGITQQLNAIEAQQQTILIMESRLYAQDMELCEWGIKKKAEGLKGKTKNGG